MTLPLTPGAIHAHHAENTRTLTAWALIQKLKLFKRVLHGRLQPAQPLTPLPDPAVPKPYDLP